jgi:hypothetical protein
MAVYIASQYSGHDAHDLAAQVVQVYTYLADQLGQEAVYLADLGWWRRAGDFMVGVLFFKVALVDIRWFLLSGVGCPRALPLQNNTSDRFIIYRDDVDVSHPFYYCSDIAHCVLIAQKWVIFFPFNLVSLILLVSLLLEFI